MEKTFLIVTLGCKVNQYESDRLARELADMGMVAAKPGEAADCVVVNTCTVTGRAAQQSGQAVRAALRNHPGAKVIAAGCHAKAAPELFAAIPGLSAVCGTSCREKLSALASSLAAGDAPPSRPLVLHGSMEASPFADPGVRPVSGKRSRPFLKIQDGCNARCSYCAVPDARGPSRSMPEEAVRRQLALLFRAGYGEVVLTGIHLGAWGLDLSPGTSLARLLESLARSPETPLLRISSIEPFELSPEIVALARDSGRICPHFHLPLQSGDDEILSLMRRPYTSSRYAEIAAGVRAALPGAAIGADVMAGFPGETDASFARAFDFIEGLPVTYLHVFPFSPREGTPASSFGGRPEAAAVKERCAALRELSRRKKAEFFASLVGSSVEICVEGRSAGSDSTQHSENMDEADRSNFERSISERSGAEPGGPPALPYKGLTGNYAPVEFFSTQALAPGAIVRGIVVAAPPGRALFAKLVH